MIKVRILMIEAESAVGTGPVEGLRARGHDVLFARDGCDALRVFRRESPDIVLADARLSWGRGLEVLQQIKGINPETKIILLTHDGSVKRSIEGLEGETISYLKKPVTPWELSEVIEKIAGLCRPETNREFVLEESKRIVMDSQIDRIWGVVNQLLIQELALGLYEIIVNAIEHGSLGITFEEKRQAIERNTYEELLKERLSNVKHAHRRVTIDYRMIPGELHYIIRDEGRGFNWQNLPAPDPDNSLLNPCGRGIYLARLYVDRLEFNEKGNEVHIVKYGKKDGGRYGSTDSH
jgi:DNA-binding response OmpR family regulator